MYFNMEKIDEQKEQLEMTDLESLEEFGPDKQVISIYDTCTYSNFPVLVVLNEQRSQRKL